MSEFEPRIIAFLCNFCSYEGADRAGSAKLEVPPNVRAIRVMCSGRVEPEMIIESFRSGADGVMILGCHPGDCHFKTGNYKARRRYLMMKMVLKQFGIEPDRLMLDWVSASEGRKFAEITEKMTEIIHSLGPLELGIDRREEK